MFLPPLIYMLLVLSDQALSKQCYWRRWPVCGTFMKCGDDHYVRTGITASCFLTPTKYCCPSSPAADIILCEQEDLKGDCVVYGVKQESCVELNEEITVRSLKTLGNCFRIYEENNCGGQSVAVYSDKNKFPRKANSIGDCFPANLIADKCPDSNITDPKCRWFTPPVNIGPSWKGIERETSEPIRFFEIGKNRRTEYLQAVLEKKHLGQCDEREIGFILPKCLGGPENDPRNSYVMSAHIDRDLWLRVIRQISSDVSQFKSVVLTVNILYENLEATKPSRLIFKTIRMDTGDTARVISVANP